jgi:hypothetical protein
MAAAQPSGLISARIDAVLINVRLPILMVSSRPLLISS